MQEIIVVFAEPQPIVREQQESIPPAIAVVPTPRRNTKNSENWSLQRDEDGNLIGTSVDGMSRSTIIRKDNNPWCNGVYLG